VPAVLLLPRVGWIEQRVLVWAGPGSLDRPITLAHITAPLSRLLETPRLQADGADYIGVGAVFPTGEA
jgi:hypothetical protein